MNYKLQVDGIYLIVILFALIIGIVVWAALWGNFVNNPIAQSKLFNKTINPVGATSAAQATKSIDLLANFVIFLFFVAAIAAIVSAIFTESNPAFAIVGIVVFPIEILLTYLFHDIFFAMASNSFLGPTIASFPIIITFMQNFPLIAGVIYLVIIIATFTK